MAIIAKSKGEGKDFPILEAGSYAARCYSMIFIGTVTEEFQGKPKEMEKVNISFEFPTELHAFNDEKVEQPYVLSKEFTLSLAEKANMRKFLEGWRGRNFTKEELEGFDIEKLLGAVCLASVKHKEPNKDNKIYAEISSVSLLPKGMACPPQITPTRLLTYENWNEELFESLPEFIRKKMESTPEYKELRSGKPKTTPNTGEEEESDLPF